MCVEKLYGDEHPKEAARLPSPPHWISCVGNGGRGVGLGLCCGGGPVGGLGMFRNAPKTARWQGPALPLHFPGPAGASETWKSPLSVNMQRRSSAFAPLCSVVSDSVTLQAEVPPGLSVHGILRLPYSHCHC